MSRLLEIINEGKEHDHLPASAFGLPSQRKFPMKDATGVRMAMVHFGNCKEENKHELARNIMKKAKQFSVVVKNANILKYAGLSGEKNVNDDPNIKKGAMGRLHKELLDAGKDDVSNLYTGNKAEKTPLSKSVQSFKKQLETTNNMANSSKTDDSELDAGYDEKIVKVIQDTDEKIEKIAQESIDSIIGEPGWKVDYVKGNVKIVNNRAEIEISKHRFTGKMEIGTASAGKFSPEEDDMENNRYIAMGKLCSAIKKGDASVKKLLNIMDLSDKFNKSQIDFDEDKINKYAKDINKLK